MDTFRLARRGRCVAATAAAMCLGAVWGTSALLAPVASASSCLTGQQTFTDTGTDVERR